MKSISTFLMLLCLTFSSILWAVPAKRINKTFTQPNGSKITIVLRGDEHFSYYSTTDGVMLKKDTDGYMKYAITNSEKELIAGKFTANNPENRNAEEKEYIVKLNKLQLNNAIEKQRAKSPIMKMPGAIGSSQFPNEGEVRGLIIMAEFQDQKFSAIGTRDELHKMMNQENYSNFDADGSARDYFISQSSDKFIPQFDVVGPVTLPNDMEFYGERIGNVMDKNPYQMIFDACKLADQQYNVDFSQYDYDKDGNVDLIYVIYAGYGEAQGAPDYTIWPHASSISRLNLNLDGKKITNYACSSELKGNRDTVIDGIGTFCHEFSHCLGLPDIYDAQGTGGFGMDTWSLMDYGCYNNGSKTPVGYSSFERFSVGWIVPTELTGPQKDIKLEALNVANKAFFITSDANKDEYYTIENRQQTGWDKYLPGHGMMIVHVNYKSSAWISNTVNMKGKERVQIVPADGVLDSKTTEGDAFPGANFNDSFTDISTPASTLYTGGTLGKPLTQIQEKDGIISFNFMDKLCPAPVATPASTIRNTEFTANWNTVKEADSYILEVAPFTTGESLLSENFSKFKASENSEDISNNLDEYTQIKGWIGSEVYPIDEACFVARTGEKGYLISPKVDLSNNETFTLCLEAVGSQAVISGIQFMLLDKLNLEKIIAQKSIIMPTTLKKIYWVFSIDETEAFIRINANARAKFQNITLYSGDVKSILEKGETPFYETKVQKQVITDIVNNSYNLKGLEDETSYIYTVRTKVDDEISDASNKIATKTQSEVSIGAISLQNKVQVSENIIKVSVQEGEQIAIYTIDGVLKYTFTAIQKENNIEIENGIYIIRIGNTSVKAIVTGK